MKSHTALLRHSAYTSLDSEQRKRFLEHLGNAPEWSSLIPATENAGLSNIFYHHLQQSQVVIPEEVERQFKALKVRQIRAHRIRTQVLVEILDAFADKKIDAILLKGAALAHVLYDSPTFRPMSDIDILVKPGDANRAQKMMRTLGFAAQDRKQGYLFDHHHLPIAHKMEQGMAVNVEIHHRALSGDATSQIDYQSLTEPTRTFEIDGRPCQALGHIDMLRHLCHHTFEPIETIKLGAVVDLFGYAEKFTDEIDWSEIKRRFPFVHNTFRCLHYLSPLPAPLHEHIQPPRCDPPQGVGKGFLPLSETLRKFRKKSDQINAMLNPSEWWMHIYYQVPPECSIRKTRNLDHPLLVSKWIWRRLQANLKSKLNRLPQ